MQSEESENVLLGKLNSALSLAKIMSPSKLRKNLIGLMSLSPEIEDNLAERIQIPMGISIVIQKSIAVIQNGLSSAPSLIVRVQPIAHHIPINMCPSMTGSSLRDTSE